MLNKISFREILAWITLAFALLLFSASIAFAQTKSINVEKDNGKVHIKINKVENGQTINIDTSFAYTDDMNLEKIIDDLSGEDGENIRHENKSIVRNKVKVEGKDGKKRKQISIDLDIPEMSEADKKKLHKDLKESMEGMHESLNEMRESIKSMHIQINSDSFDDKDFSFDLDIPEIDSDKLHDCISNSYSYSYSHSYDDETDSLNDKDHVIIIGDKGENPPVFEKSITSKSGKQIFVYKRSVDPDRIDKEEKLSKDDERDVDETNIRSLSYYPNPTNGKLKLMFRVDDRSDVTIKILDSNSKVVYNEKLSGFEGEYSREIDLSSKSKGNYLLKIIQGKNSIAKKIVVN